MSQELRHRYNFHSWEKKHVPSPLGNPHLQFQPKQGCSGGWAVDGPVAPGGGQAHRVVVVHVGQEKQPCARTLPYVPEVHCQRRVRDNFTVDWHGLAGCGAAGGLIAVVYLNAIQLVQGDTEKTAVKNSCFMYGTSKILSYSRWQLAIKTEMPPHRQLANSRSNSRRCWT